MNLNLQHKSPQTLNGEWVYTGGDIFIIKGEPYVLSYVDDNFDSSLVCLNDGLLWDYGRMQMKDISEHVFITHYNFTDYMDDTGCNDWYYFGRFEEKLFNIEEIGEWD